MDNPSQALGVVAKQTESSEMAACRELVSNKSIVQWVGNDETVAEFMEKAEQGQPFHAYHKGGSNVTEQQSFEGGSITCRSLCLGRFGMTHADMLYGADNYMSCLGLSLDSLKELNGKKIIDLGCGDAIFPSEAKSIFGIDVCGVDLFAEEDNFEAKKKIFKQYAKNLVFAEYVRQVRQIEPPGNIGQSAMRGLCLQSIQDTYKYYMTTSPKKDDATKLSFGTNQFDGAISSWLFMYLTESQSLQALSEMVRVTKSGGFIRICQGFSIQSDPGKGLPGDVSAVKGISEVNFDQKEQNYGGLRVFLVKK